MAGGIIAIVLLAALLGSGVYMRLKSAIAHGPLDDGEVGDIPHLHPEQQASVNTGEFVRHGGAR